MPQECSDCRRGNGCALQCRYGFGRREEDDRGLDPAADHGWTAGVVYHANAAAKEINAAFPNIEVIVKTSPSAARR